eukprot:6639989-Prymnesium_polylepis.1
MRRHRAATASAIVSRPRPHAAPACRFIDFGYTTNSLFIEKDEAEDVFFGCANGGNTYKIVLVLFTLCLFVG